MEFPLPSRFDDHSFGVISQLQALDSEPNLVLDFRNVSYVFPFPTLAIAIAIRDLTEKRIANGLRTSALGTDLNHGAISYLKYFGFFRALGFPIGNAPNSPSGGNRYLPITIITRKELEDSAADRPYQYEIDKHGDRLAQVIVPGEENAGSAMMLSYCFREIIRNSFEHAGVDKCVVMAQRWYDGDAEITIADRGIGIHKSLLQERIIDAPEDAIRQSLLPGVTSGSNRATGSEWDNSGFGLYVTSELGRRYGDFGILSSNRLLTRNNNHEEVREVPLSGTIVKLRINTRDGDYFPNILSMIVTEGEEIAGTLEGAVKSASKMSKSHSLSKLKDYG